MVVIFAVVVVVIVVVVVAVVGAVVLGAAVVVLAALRASVVGRLLCQILSSMHVAKVQMEEEKFVLIRWEGEEHPHIPPHALIYIHIYIHIRERFPKINITNEFQVEL